MDKVVNDFSITVGTKNGSGSSTANRPFKLAQAMPNATIDARAAAPKPGLSPSVQAISRIGMRKVAAEGQPSP